MREIIRDKGDGRGVNRGSHKAMKMLGRGKVRETDEG